ncbi:unnamed protein product [Rotaria sp. Silwood2]|nr:unnamed protein product [Rotaria sp. Silwood2]
MSDRQPLLNSTNKLSIGDDDDDHGNRQQLLSDRFSDWRRCFNRKESDTKYITLEDNAEQSEKNEPVDVFRLFRFADRIDLVLMLLGICLGVLHAICIVANLVFFGRLTGIFVTESFGDNCDHQYQNSTASIKNYDAYPQAIKLNIFNNAPSHKLGYDNFILLSNLATSMPSFREKVMNIVQWLFITGGIEFLTGSIGHYIWTITVKRQICRMRVSLFQSLIQRSIPYMDTKPTSQLNAKLLDFIGPFLQAVSEAQGAASSVFRVIDEGNGTGISEIDVWNEDKESIYNINGDIEFDNVNFVYPSRKDVPVLHNLSLIARAGQTTALVGSSGCGKSTCISMILRYYEPSSGRITIDGRPITDYNVKQLRQNIGVVSQEPILFDMSIYENIRFGKLNATRTEIEQAAREANAHNFIMQLPNGNDASINEKEVWEENTEAVNNINGDIVFSKVNFSYPSRKDASVLRNLSFIARAGQTTALVGSNGCGKSTCISLFLRYYEPSSGRITIDGRPITDCNVKELRQNIGVVNQEPILFSMSIYENIRFGKVNATRIEIEQAAREANAHNFIMQLPDKYETHVGERGIQLSGGEKQRIALARVLVKQPTFLLLDEATSALDNINEKIVQEALDRACKGRTTIVIAHRLTTIENAHKIYVLDNGTVIEEGTHKTLIAKEGGKYQTMIKRQQMARIDDDNDDIMSIDKATEEGKKSISLLTFSS